ncbi:MAG: hypothetical protein KQH59_18335 [Desulfobulbaceae bacterium]|nr:hypothetical protein [Desulfobulbaceae bacterium]
MITRYEDGAIEIRGDKGAVICFKGRVEPHNPEIDDSETMVVDFGEPAGWRYICPRCGVRNGDNLPVVVGEGIETGGCRQCFDDSGLAAAMVEQLREVVTGVAVPVPVWW